MVKPRRAGADWIGLDGGDGVAGSVGEDAIIGVDIEVDIDGA